MFRVRPKSKTLLVGDKLTAEVTYFLDKRNQTNPGSTSSIVGTQISVPPGVPNRAKPSHDLLQWQGI